MEIDPASPTLYTETFGAITGDVVAETGFVVTTPELVFICDDTFPLFSVEVAADVGATAGAAVTTTVVGN
jgi:hypothetical protein